MYIPEDQMPNYTDLRKQRSNQTVLDSENFERVVRAKSAQEMRKSRFRSTLEHFPDIDHHVVNDIADLIRDQWVLRGNTAKRDSDIQLDIKNVVIQQYLQANSTISSSIEHLYDEVISFMKTTDEALLLEKVPHISYSDRNPKNDPNTGKSSEVKKGEKRQRDDIEQIYPKTAKTNHGQYTLKRPYDQEPNSVPKRQRSSKIQEDEILDEEETDQIPISSRGTPLYRFVNTGVSCYINAALQFFLSLEMHEISVIPSQEALVQYARPEGSPLLRCALAFGDITSQPHGTLITPTTFSDPLFEHLDGQIQPGRQEDLCEAAFETILLNNYLFSRTNFNLILKTLTTCSVCNHVSITPDEKPYLILEMPHHDACLPDIIHDRITRSELLNGDNQYYCNYCMTNTDASQRQSFYEPLPPVLVIQLSRFIYTQNGSFKNTSKLGIDPFTLTLHVIDDGGVEKSVNYILHSTISHIGNAIEHGHYIATVKHGNKWYKCNDTSITLSSPGAINPEEVIILAFKKSEITLPESTHMDSQTNHRTEPDSSDVPHDGQGSAGHPLQPSFFPNKCVGNKVLLVKNDITKLTVDCIVNAAKCTLDGGGGVDGAIHAAAGPKLAKYCVNELKYCHVGEAVISPSFELSKQSIKNIIHTVGPQNGDKLMLAKCYENSLNYLTDKKYSGKIRTIAFPCIATAIYGFNNTRAAHIALQTIRDWLETNHSQVDQIIFCTFIDKDFQIYKNLISQYFPDYPH